MTRTRGNASINPVMAVGSSATDCHAAKVKYVSNDRPTDHTQIDRRRSQTVLPRADLKRNVDRGWSRLLGLSRFLDSGSTGLSVATSLLPKRNTAPPLRTSTVRASQASPLFKPLIRGSSSRYQLNGLSLAGHSSQSNRFANALANHAATATAAAVPEATRGDPENAPTIMAKAPKLTPSSHSPMETARRPSRLSFSSIGEFSTARVMAMAVTMARVRTLMEASF